MKSKHDRSSEQVSWLDFSSHNALANQLADDITANVAQAIAGRGQAVLALSGGSTPKPLFQALLTRDIDWSKVVITLVDERWVDESHELSNGAFLKRFLLNELNVNATFVPLYQAADSAQGSLPTVLANYCRVTDSQITKSAPFDVVVLGMGTDGHTASFFPDASNIEQLLDITTDQALFVCDSPTTQVPRVTWSLPCLLNTQSLVLHITGEQKKTVFEQATVAVRNADSSMRLPISAVIEQAPKALKVYYAD